MSMKKLCLAFFAVALLGVAGAQAADLLISIGIRETGGAGPAFANAGTSNGIEWVNLDGQTLTADGTWQQFTFTPAVDLLTGFAGSTANSFLEIGDEWASLEHIRVLNSDGITAPIFLWIDDVTVNESAGGTSEGFESFAVDDEVMFQEPSFSGSTSGNINAGDTAGVTDGMAFTGAQSYRASFQFVDNDPTRWVRLTSFQTASLNVPNPFIRTIEPGQADPTVTFWLNAVEGSLVDVDVDSDVDGKDFLEIQRDDPASIPAWEDEFGDGVGPLASVGAVPEPTAVSLALMAAAGLLLTTRRR